MLKVGKYVVGRLKEGSRGVRGKCKRELGAERWVEVLEVSARKWQVQEGGKCCRKLQRAR